MVSIKEFFELREAGYSVDQIKEYSSFIEAPEQKPEQKPDPTAERLKEVQDSLSMLIGAIRGMNINGMGMPEQHDRGVNEILAEIINPPKKQK